MALSCASCHALASAPSDVKPGICDIDVLHSGHPSISSDFEKHMRSAKPVLIRGLVEDSDSMVNWKKDHLEKTVFTQLNVNLTRDDYFLRRIDVVSGRIIDGDVNEFTIPGKGLGYEFRGQPSDCDFKPLNHVNFPPFVNQNHFTDFYMMAGETGSGLPFHSHDDTVNKLVSGEKEWLLYSPDKAYNAPSLSYKDSHAKEEWRGKIGDLQSEDRPLRCTQHSGDMLFIPRHWKHAVYNRGFTVAVSAMHEGSTPTPTYVKDKIEFIGRQKTPIGILDGALPQSQFEMLEDFFRHRTDYKEGHANQVSFPGKVAPIDKKMVTSLVKRIARSSIVGSHFPQFTEDLLQGNHYLSGFVSILCDANPWVHHDAPLSSGSVSGPPAAVLHFGFGKGHDHKTTGTAFYREKQSGLERASDAHIPNNISRSDFCELYPHSLVCEFEHDHEGENDRVEDYEEIFRVEGKPNRMIVYPQNVLHNAFAENPADHKIFRGPHLLPCSSESGRMAISLHVSEFETPWTIKDSLTDSWRLRATYILRRLGEVCNKEHQAGLCCSGDDVAETEYCYDFKHSKARCGTHWHCHAWFFGCINNHYPSNQCGLIKKCPYESCLDNEFLKGCGGNSNAGTCTPCGSCSGNQFREGCGGGHGGNCKPCNTNCPAGSFLFGCGYTNPGSCVTCPPCDNPAFTRTGCGGLLEGTCSKCSEGYYHPKEDPENCIALQGAGGPSRDRAGTNPFSCKENLIDIDGTCCSSTGLIQDHCQVCYTNKESSVKAGRCKVCNHLYAGDFCLDCNTDTSYEKNGVCLFKKSDGMICSHDYQCNSLKCPREVGAGSCCQAGVITQIGSPHQCLGCDNSGKCIHCAQPLKYEGPFCRSYIPQPAGSSCESDDQCESENCAKKTLSSGFCCSDTVQHCELCDANGGCAKCEDGFTVHDGGCFKNCADPFESDGVISHGQWTTSKEKFYEPYVAGEDTCRSERQRLLCEDGVLTKCETIPSMTSCSFQYDSCSTGCGELKINEESKRIRYEKSSVKPGQLCKIQVQKQRCIGSDHLSLWTYDSGDGSSSDTFTKEYCSVQCADSCTPIMQNNQVCDLACNTASCSFDSESCLRAGRNFLNDAKILAEVNPKVATAQLERLCKSDKWGYDRTLADGLIFQSSVNPTDNCEASDAVCTSKAEEIQALRREACSQVALIESPHQRKLVPLDSWNYFFDLGQNLISQSRFQENQIAIKKMDYETQRAREALLKRMASFAVGVHEAHQSANKDLKNVLKDGLNDIRAEQMQREEIMSQKDKRRYSEMLARMEGMQILLGDNGKKLVKLRNEQGAEARETREQLTEALERLGDNVIDRLSNEVATSAYDTKRVSKEQTDLVLKAQAIANTRIIDKVDGVKDGVDETGRAIRATYKKLKDIEEKVDEVIKDKGKQEAIAKAKLEALAKQADRERDELQSIKDGSSIFFSQFKAGGTGFDRDGDNKVNPCEMLDAINYFSPWNTRLGLDIILPKFLHIMSQVDDTASGTATNCSGQGVKAKSLAIALEEFDYYEAKKLWRFLGHYTAFDLDKDGFISAEEVIRLLHRQKVFGDQFVFLEEWLGISDSLHKTALLVEQKLVNNASIIFQAVMKKNDNGRRVLKDGEIELIRVSIENAMKDLLEQYGDNLDLYAVNMDELASTTGNILKQVAEDAEDYVDAQKNAALVLKDDIQDTLSQLSWKGLLEKGGDMLISSIDEGINTALGKFGLGRFESRCRRILGALAIIPDAWKALQSAAKCIGSILTLNLGGALMGCMAAYKDIKKLCDNASRFAKSEIPGIWKDLEEGSKDVALWFHHLIPHDRRRLRLNKPLTNMKTNYGLPTFVTDLVILAGVTLSNKTANDGDIDFKRLRSYINSTVYHLKLYNSSSVVLPEASLDSFQYNQLEIKDYAEAKLHTNLEVRAANASYVANRAAGESILAIHKSHAFAESKQMEMAAASWSLEIATGDQLKFSLLECYNTMSLSCEANPDIKCPKKNLIHANTRFDDLNSETFAAAFNTYKSDIEPSRYTRQRRTAVYEFSAKDNPVEISKFGLPLPSEDSKIAIHVPMPKRNSEQKHRYTGVEVHNVEVFLHPMPLKYSKLVPTLTIYLQTPENSIFVDPHDGQTERVFDTGSASFAFAYSTTSCRSHGNAVRVTNSRGGDSDIARSPYGTWALPLFPLYSQIGPENWKQMFNINTITLKLDLEFNEDFEEESTGIFNGGTKEFPYDKSEEGVCSIPAWLPSCTTLQCPDSHVQRSDIEETRCLGAVCDLKVDLERCCRLRASCESISAIDDFCPKSHVPRQDLEEYLCKGSECVPEKRDQDACCAPRASCSEYECDATLFVPETKNSLCEGHSCNVAKDLSTCCKKRDSCEGFQCPVDWAAAEKSKQKLCKGLVCDEIIDLERCCTPLIDIALCASYSCPTGTAPRHNIEDISCIAEVCTDEKDLYRCCENEDTGLDGDLKINARCAELNCPESGYFSYPPEISNYIYCSGPVCNISLDVPRCCLKKWFPGLSMTSMDILMVSSILLVLALLVCCGSWYTYHFICRNMKKRNSTSAVEMHVRRNSTRHPQCAHAIGLQERAGKFKVRASVSGEDFVSIDPGTVVEARVVG